MPLAVNYQQILWEQEQAKKTTQSITAPLPVQDPRLSNTTAQSKPYVPAQLQATPILKPSSSPVVSAPQVSASPLPVNAQQIIDMAKNTVQPNTGNTSVSPILQLSSKAVETDASAKTRAEISIPSDINPWILAGTFLLIVLIVRR